MKTNKKFIKRIMIIIGTIICISCLSMKTYASESEETIIASGEYGNTEADEVYWKVDSEGTLTISGRGDMIEIEPGDSSTIPGSPWSGCTVKKVVIEEGVTSIGAYAFYNNQNLTSVEIPSSVKKIGEWTFYQCINLENVEFSEGLLSIEKSAFHLCQKLDGIELPSTLSNIGDSAFADCFMLSKMVIPSNVKTIGKRAFSSCKNMVSIELPKGITDIKEETFCFCKVLEKINIPSGVTTIEKNAFSQCYGLKEVIVPKSVTSIDELAFNYVPDYLSGAYFYVYRDSYAENWATANGRRYIVKYLDENGDASTTPETPETTDVSVTYHTHIQSYGDSQGTKKNGEMAGTSGEAKRLENIWIDIEGNDNLGVQYSTHCQSYGWMPWSCDGETNGTSGEAKRLEAIKIQLTGADKDKYDIYYRVHAQSYGWLGWAKNGEPSGTAGYAKRLEGIQVVVVKKGESAPALNYAGVDGSSSKYKDQPYVAAKQETIVIPGDVNAPIVSYKTHVQSFGWQKWVHNGAMSGTSGQAKRLEGINIKVTNCPYDGDIVYTTHVQTYGWQGKPDDATRTGWKKNGEMSGTSGEAKRLEAICIDLTGEMGEKYDVYYRVHAQSFGWLGWAKNGEESGTAGYAKRLEGIQIVLIPEGGEAPANDFGGVTSVKAEAYVEK